MNVIKPYAHAIQNQFDMTSYQVISIQDPLDLTLLRQKNTSMIIWERQQQSEIQTFLKMWQKENHSFYFEGFLDELVKRLKLYFANELCIFPEACRALISDVKLLASYFQTLTRCRGLNISLEKITDNRCTRFHADYNHWRLLCTYIGPGTIYVNPKDVLWTPSELSHSKCTVAEDVAYKQLLNFDVAILKGRLHPDSQGYGQVHKSPALDACCPYRILLRIDESA